jgi:hypothetical protein
MPAPVDIPYPSTLRDADNQPLCLGTLRFYKGADRGAFWPQAPTNAQTLVKDATSVLVEDGKEHRVFRILNAEYVHSEFPEGGHYEFELGEIVAPLDPAG